MVGSGGVPIFFCLGLMLNVPVNNFFSHVRTEPPLPGYYQCFFFFGGGGGG